MGFVENVNKLAAGMTDTLQNELTAMQNDITDLQTNKVDIVVGKQLSTEDYTTGEKDKLAGINPGATANQTDAYLLNRDNHTGTQTADTIEETLSRVFVTPTQKGLISTAEQVGNKNVAGGYAGINGAGKIDSGLLPDLNVSQVFPNVPDEASMLALPAGLGDIAIRTDLSDVAFMCISIPSTVIGNWRQLNSTAAVTSVNSKIGAVLLDTSDISENGNLYYTDERVDDRVATLLQAGTNISISYDDTAGTLTIGTTGIEASEVSNTPTGNIVATTVQGAINELDVSITALETSVVYTTGDQTIAGVKTFTSFPITPSSAPTTNYQVANKKYVDDKVATISYTVNLTGDQTIAGVKTFTSSPIVPTPTNPTDVANKSYVDNRSDISYKSTPITITSWSYSGTTVTLNVASHTFVASDYIEVSGLTATTNPANGVWQVSSVTATTIVYTVTNTPTGIAGVSSATVKGYSTVNSIAGGIGVNQSYQDVTGSRTLGVTYTNTSGRPKTIILMVSIYASAGSRIDFYVNGVRVAYAGNIASAANIYIPLTVIVPNGANYQATSNVSATVTQWEELG